MTPARRLPSLTERQVQLLALLGDLHQTVRQAASDRGDPPYNEWFASEAEARFFHGILTPVVHGRPTRFPGDPPPAPRPRAGSGPTVFEAIKAAVPVEVLAARFTDLRPGGPNRLRGKCPIHDERTPSFVLSVDRQRWRCFGACAEGGDTITLAQRLMDKGKL